MNCSRKYVYACLCFLTLVIAEAHYLSARTQGKAESAAAVNPRLSAPYAPALLAPAEISVHAKSAVLMDATTGEILLAHNPDQGIPPASFAKLLTLYVTFDMMKHQKLRLVDEVFVSKKAWRTGGSKMFIEVNSKVPVEELIKGIAIVSGNDACVAMAEHLSGDTATFTKVMNKYAQQLGMDNSHFSNPHGLPEEEQLTTARDMAILARSYINNFPEALQYHSMLEFTYSDITQKNRNGLLRKSNFVDGLKTGWVEKSGYNLLATAMKDNQRLIAVVMGAKNVNTREKEALKLLNYGYQNFSLLSFFEEGQVLTEIPVWKGKSNTLSIIPQQNSLLVIPREYENKISKMSSLPADIVAPVQKGQVVGEYVITIGTQLLKSIPLIAAESVGKAGFFKALSHQMYLYGRKAKMRWFILTGSIVSLGTVAILALRGKFRRKRSGFRF